MAYTFSTQVTEEEPYFTFRAELQALGLKPPSLKNILGGLDAQEIQRRLTKARVVLSGYASPPRNPASVAADVLKNPEKYEIQSTLLPLSYAPALPPTKRAASPRKVAELVAPPASAENVLKTLRFLLKAHLDITEIDALQVAVSAGRLDGATLVRDASLARAALGMQAFIDALREQLR